MSEQSRRSELEFIKNFVDRTYNNYGNLLVVDTDKPYDPEHTELGYCFKHKDSKSGNVIYKIVCSPTGVPEADLRILMHEYGHIYLGHLDGISEELDTQICNVFRDYRPELIEHINKSCGIDFADKLIERVIDDPSMNHAIHNIAMDFSVNSVVLNKEDIEIMERGVDSVLPHNEEEVFDYLSKNAKDEKMREEYKKVLDKMKKETKIKFMIPSRYHKTSELDASGNPESFPDGLSYPEYLMLIIENLDQFVKMLVSIQMGGNGDTSQVTMQDIQNALQNANNEWQKKSDEYKQGYNDALNDYKNGKVGQKPNAPQNNQQGNQNQDQSGQQGQQQSQSSGNQSGQQSSGQGNQSGQQSSASGSSGSQGQNGQQNGSQGNQSGQGGKEGSYEDGYNDALRDIANSQGQGSGQGMQSLSDLMNNSGMSGDQQDQGQQDGQGKDGQGQGGQSSGRTGQRPPLTDKDAGMDHRTDSRDEADKKREAGEIRSGGGFGCGSDGGPDARRIVNKNLDEVDMALREVLNNVKARVVKTSAKKDQLKLFNRGVIRSTIVPSFSTKVTVCNDPTIVFLIDISGSMDTQLIDRILLTINNNLRKISKGLRYNIITWSTRLGEHIKDIDPKKGVPKISCGGGTRMAEGIKYFKENYNDNAILVVISDFEDYLEEWHEVEKGMSKYAMYGFNYGCSSYRDSDSISWSYMKIRKFNSRR